MGIKLVMRRNDWEKRLINTIQARDAPFKWAGNDCCQMALDVVEAVTGEPVAHDYQYTDKRGAINLMNRHGGVVGIVDGILDRTDNPMRGDIVADEHDGKFCLGICMGAVSAFISPVGMEYNPLSDESISWRVA